MAETLPLQDLSLKDKGPAPEPAAPSASQQKGKADGRSGGAAQEDSTLAAEQHLSSNEEPVLFALASPSERVQVLRIEDEVLAFIGDANRDVLEFPLEYGNYQRLLAHKVAQYHGLQTSTADYEGPTGRVVAHRKYVETKSRPKLSQLVVSLATAAAAAQQQQLGSRGSNAAPSVADSRPKLLRRPSGSEGQRSPGADADRPQVVKSQAERARDREEEYNRARQRIMGSVAMGSPPAAPAAAGAASPQPQQPHPQQQPQAHGPGSSSSNSSSTGSALAGGGRANGAGGRFGPMGGRAGAAGGFQGGGRGRGRKGGRGDRAAELQHDPDYMRGPHRYGPPGGAYDPTANGYVMPGPVYAMPYAPEAGRDPMAMHPAAPPGAALYPPSMPLHAAAGMHTYPSPAHRGPHPPGTPMGAAPPPHSPMRSGKYSSGAAASSAPPAMGMPPQMPHASAAMPAQTPHGYPAAPAAAMPPPAAMAAPYAPAMTSMGMAYPSMPPGTPSMYGAMHPGAYPYPMGMTSTPPIAYPGTYPGPQDPMAAAAMQGMHMQHSSHPMAYMHLGMMPPHMHPGMPPGRGMMPVAPYPGAMPQGPYPHAGMQTPDGIYTMPAAPMYHPAAMQVPPGTYPPQPHHTAPGSSPYHPSNASGNYYSGGGGGGGGRGRGGGYHRNRDYDSHYQGGKGGGRGGEGSANSHNSHSSTNTSASQFQGVSNHSSQGGSSGNAGEASPAGKQQHTQAPAVAGNGKHVEHAPKQDAQQDGPTQ